ncbi:MAG TPA: M1 family aminopeptidase [Thermoanaerobaculia bacterium]|nr:M1 family aminopeptidase [Thermoanaerobaculia bacterium]
MRHRFTLLAFAGLLATSAFALDPKNARAEYDRMQKWQFSREIPLAAPVTITRDTATWTLTSGTFRVMEPAGDGAITGFVFEGQGQFRMTIPDRYEVAQLRRFAKRADLETIDQPFTQLVIRTSDSSVAKLFPAEGASAYAPYPPASKRHEAWLVDLFEDVDARVIEGMLNPGAMQFVADMKSADFDWLTYDYDSAADEEITLVRTNGVGSEVWVSLDRPEERKQDGHPAATTRRVSLDHIDVKADLTKMGRNDVGESKQRTLYGKYVVEATFTGLAETTQALALALAPSAKEVKAFSESGAPLAVFRDRIGKRSRDIDNKYYDDEFLVVLDAPLKRGEKQRVRFEYEFETANYAPGRAWYPTVPDSYDQKHTARLELTVRRKNELRAMGRMEKRTENGDSETSIWVVDWPTKMVTFSTATRFEQVKVAVPNIPPIFSFGPDYQFTNTQKLHNVAADVANSMQYFQGLLGSNVGAEQYYVTSIAAGHGQSFDGFLHMTEWTYGSEHPGASELFRAHEVAHAWWGHKVGWKTYRDQWLSEAFAEYCAMLFVKDFVKGGDKYFEEILRSYDGIVKGNFSGGFSKFNRPWLIERSSSDRARLGPIGHGWRAGTNEIPYGYTIQTYHKGPLVVHMLRTIIGMRTGSDEPFFKTLKDFLQEYDGKAASTEDFRRVLERNLGGNDMGWFFDAWIYRAEIPSYTWKYTVKPEGDAFLLTIDIERRDVPDSFVTVIPVRVEFEGNKQGYVFIPSKQAKQTVTQKLPAKPKNVIFAPDFSLLASVKRQ